MTEAASTHPNDEWLVAYLTTGLSAGEHRGVDVHLQGCDRCIGSLSTMQRRLGLAATVAVPVPAAIAGRAAPLAVPGQSSARQPASWSAIFDHVARVFRLPILVPAAVAAIAVVVLVSQSDMTRPSPQREKSRAVEMRQLLPVTVTEAEVWPQAERSRDGTTGEPALARLKRGTKVAVVGEKGGWYQVALPDGRTGWMERSAFE